MVAIGCLCLCPALVPSYAEAHPPEIVHVRYTADDGLSNNAVSNIIQDRKGFIWLATWDGLNRFDGYRFVNYRTDDKSQTPMLHNRINTLMEDVSGNIWAQMYDEKLFRFNCSSEQFESLTHGNPEIPDFRVGSLFQTSLGDIWAATDQPGLIQITIDRTTGRFALRSYPLPHRKISVLCEDSHANVWAGTNRGAALLSHPEDNGSFVCRESLLTRHHITAILSHGEQVWFGTSDGSLYNYNLRNEKINSQPLAVLQKPITALAISTNEKQLYAGTGQGGCVQINTFSRECRKILPEGITVKRLFIDSHNLVWILTDRPGITKYDPATGCTANFIHKVTVPEYYWGIDKITEHDGTVWAALTGGGFGYYDRTTDRFEYFHNDPGRAPVFSNVVTDFLIDSSNVVWMTTHERGIERAAILDKTVDRVFVEPDSERISDNEFRAFLLDRQGNLWAATKSGYLYRLDKNLQVRDRISTDDKGNPLGYIYAILQDRSGAFWLGTKGNGLFRMTFDNKEGEGPLHFEHFVNISSDPYSLGNDMVYSILEDKHGRLWIGTYGGGINLLQRDSAGAVKFLTPDNALRGYPRSTCRKVRALCQAPDGSIWAGTTEGTVRLFFDPEHNDVRAKIFRKETGESHTVLSNDIIALFSDSHGNIWSATVGGGLIECHIGSNGEPRFKSYTTREGMPSNDVKSITEDRRGNIWAGTERHICMLNPANGVLSVFSNYEGLGTTMLSETTALALDDKRVIFGTLNGIYVVDNDYFSGDSKREIRMEITGIQFNDRQISPQEGSVLQSAAAGIQAVLLPDRHVVFSFSYTSLNYSVQHRVHYRYMLEGYDKTWQNDEGQRRAVYAAVPYGKYRFRVQAFLPGAPDIYEEHTVQVEVPPFFWETRMAIGLYILIVALLVTGVILLLHRKRLLIHGMRVFKIGPSEIILNNESDQKFLTGIMEWLEKNYSNPDLIIDDMVTPSGMSRSSFYNRLKLLAQMSPVELLNDFRIKKAEMYLKNSNLSISEIAYRMGFNDPAYFARIFKARHGISPTIFRKNTSEHYQKVD